MIARLKWLGRNERKYIELMVNKIKRFDTMTMTPMKYELAEKGLELEFYEVSKDLFKLKDTEKNRELIKERIDRGGEQAWSIAGSYHFDAGWLEIILPDGLEDAVKII